jgi:PhzF family phenazine biosynthesis protein
MEYEFALVDVFAAEPFAGNPAGVVLNASGLTDGQMQQIAAEVRASETAFVLPATSPEARLRIRWFTPGTEVNMCGHATIGAVHALVESGRFAGLLDSPHAPIAIETKGGLLRARCERMPNDPKRFLVWLDLVDPALTPEHVNPAELGKLLGISSDLFESELPSMRTQDDDLIVFVRDLAALATAAPDFRALQQWCHGRNLRGVLVSTLNTVSKSIGVQSRFFAPAAGIDEDPVTGSVHGPLGVYLVANQLAPTIDRTATLNCLQGVSGGRTGLVRVLVTQHPGRGYSARIAGQCMTTIRGKVII